MKEIQTLLKRELLSEWRERYALNGLLLYAAGTVFICYMSFNVKRNVLNAPTWNAVFWIIILFIAVNASAKSFVRESPGRTFYLYTLASPKSIILSKIIYNTFLLLFVSMAVWLFYMMVVGNPVQDPLLFGINIALGAVSLGVALTMISAIASKTDTGHTLTAVLGFPVIIPVLLLLIKISKNAVDGLGFASVQSELMTLVGVDAIIVTVTLMLFPYLWRS